MKKILLIVCLFAFVGAGFARPVMKAMNIAVTVGEDEKDAKDKKKSCDAKKSCCKAKGASKDKACAGMMKEEASASTEKKSCNKPCTKDASHSEKKAEEKATTL